MGKKCIPGVMCIENMTLFILVVGIIMVSYLIFSQHKYSFSRQGGLFNPTVNDRINSPIIVVQQPALAPLGPMSGRPDPFNDPYAPPLKTDGLFYPTRSANMQGIPVNMQTRGPPANYQQFGILTRTNGNKDLILPLMGRQSMTGRDKYQYYTISNTGSLNTKLPVSFHGKSCTSEYGCDNISDGDTVYVEGYSDTFRATIYENNLFQYIPV